MRVMRIARPKKIVYMYFDGFVVHHENAIEERILYRV
jgi:hypothetical protein